MIISKTIYKVESQPDEHQLIGLLLGLVGISLLSFLFGIKTYHFKYKYISYSKLLVIFLYICSWAFLFSSIPIILTNNENYASCLAQNFICDIFYPSTKLLIYLWLIERVWIVKADRTSRLKDTLYRFHLLILIPYIGIFISLLYFHLTIISQDGYCYIGIEFKTSIIIVVYDFIINLYLTALFVAPILKLNKDKIIDHRKSKLKTLARRTMIASAICLFASFANICALSILQLENGSICFIACYFDVMINVVTIHIVTNPDCFLLSFFLSSTSISSSISSISLISSSSLQGRNTRRNTMVSISTFNNNNNSDSVDTKIGSSTSSTSNNNRMKYGRSSSSISYMIPTSPPMIKNHHKKKKGKHKLKKSMNFHLNRIEKNWQMETIHSTNQLSIGENNNITIPRSTYHPLDKPT